MSSAMTPATAVPESPSHTGMQADSDLTGLTPVLEAINVTKHFDVRDAAGQPSVVHAVENASLRLFRGHIVALVGESGSGKTTLAKLLAAFYPVTSGEIRLADTVIDASSKRPPKSFYRTVQMVFQDPFGSLNSMHRVRYNIERALQIHGHANHGVALRQQVLEILERVNLTPAAEIAEKYPYELSGGQRQRVVIARALAVQPTIVLGDEPISMLDVSIRLDMLNLLAKLRDEEQLALLYITHDIASARYLADQLSVMYAGQMVEGGPTEAIIAEPWHPYTELLVESSPNPDRIEDGTAASLFGSVETLGEPPSLVHPPTGCRFHPRCPLAHARCAEDVPPRVEGPGGRWVHCWARTSGELVAMPAAASTATPSTSKETSA